MIVVVALMIASSASGYSQLTIPALNDNFEAYRIVQVEIERELQDTYRERSDINISIPSPYGDGMIELELHKSNVISDDYSLVISDDNGYRQVQGSTITPLRGRVSGRPETIVNVVIDYDYFFACIDDGRHKYYYEPLTLYGADRNNRGVVVYKDTDVKPTAGMCGSKAVEYEIEKIRHTDNYRAGECFEVEYAVASDFNIYQQLGSVGSVEAFVISITDLMNTNYELDFNDELRHIVVQQVVSTSNAGDVWLQNGPPGTIDELLEEFTFWAPGGFTANHDLGSLWTGYDLSGNTIGLAWLGVVCRSFSYNVVERFSSNLNALRTLLSHEIGHNYNASHDATGGFIMSASLSVTNDWSSASINAINGYYESYKDTCFDNCAGGGGGGNAPVANFSYQIQDNCTPGSVNFTDQSTNNPTSWEWSFEGGTPSTSTQRNPVVSYNSPGTFNVTLTVSNANGSDVLARNNIISIDNPPEAFFTFQQDGNTVNFINLSEFAENYFWEFGNGQTSTLTNPSMVYNQPGTYEVRLRASNDCGSDFFTRDVVIEDPLIADFIADNLNPCVDEVVQFTDFSEGSPTSWLWEFEGGTPSVSTQRNPQVTYSSSGAFNVELTVSNASGSDNQIFFNYIRAENHPVALFDFTIDGSVVTFDNNSFYSNGFFWDFGDGNTSTSPNPVHDYGQSGNYDVILRAENGCGNDIALAEVNISLPPVAGIDIQGNGEICAGESVQFFESASDNTTSYSWEFQGGSPSGSSQPNPVVTYNTPGIYDVTLTVSNSDGNDVLTLNNAIIVNDIPQAAFGFNKDEGSVQFINNSVNAVEYSWDFGDGSESGLANPSHQYTSNGDYQVSLIAINECGDDFFIQDINVVLSPVAQFEIEGSGEICFGSTIQFFDNSSNDPESYMWTFEGGIPATSTDPNPAVSYPEGGNYNVTLSVENAAGTSTISLENIVVVTPPPSGSFEYEVLNDASVTFTSNTNAATDILWDFGDGTSSNEVSPTKSYEVQGIYEVTMEVLNECSSSSSSLMVNNYLKPEAAFSISDDMICAGSSIDIIDQSIGADLIYSWEFIGADNIESNQVEPVVSYANQGQYDIQLVVSNPGGSDTMIVEDAVQVFELPISDVIVDFEGLQLITTNNSTSVAEDIWDFGDGNTSLEDAPVHDYAAEDIYNVTHVLTNMCGSDTSSFEVNLYTVPIASFALTQEEGCLPFSPVFINNSSDNTTQYLWLFEGGTPSMSTDISPSVVFQDEGFYDITLIVSNPSGADTLEIVDAIEINDVPDAGFDFIKDQLDVEFIPLDTQATSYIWEFGDGDSSNEEYPAHSFDGEGEFVVSLQAANECGSTISDTTLQVNMLPSAGLGFDLSEICFGNQVQFFQESSSNALTFDWLFEGGSPSTSQDENPLISYSEPGVYNVQLIVGGVEGTDTLSLDSVITVKGLPDINAHLEVTGNMITLTDSTANKQTSSFLLWQDTIVGDKLEYVVSQNGIVPVTLIVSNECGSVSKEFETEITVYPEAALKFDQVLSCPGQPFTLSGESLEQGQYQWNITGQDTTVTVTGIEPQLSLENSGSYDIELIVTNNYGSDTLVVADGIRIENFPVAEIQIEQEGSTIIGTAVHDIEAEFTWDFGDGATASGDSVTHVYEREGSYQVMLLVANACGEYVVSQEVEIISSSTENPLLGSDIRVFPNPVQSHLIIDLSKVDLKLDYQLFNMEGREIERGIIEKEIDEYKIDMDLYNPSIYILRVTDGMREDYLKIVKVK